MSVNQSNSYFFNVKRFKQNKRKIIPKPLRQCPFSALRRKCLSLIAAQSCTPECHPDRQTCLWCFLTGIRNFSSVHCWGLICFCSNVNKQQQQKDWTRKLCINSSLRRGNEITAWQSSLQRKWSSADGWYLTIHLMKLHFSISGMVCL